MENFEMIFNNLEDIDKKSVNAYRSARQFKSIAINQIVFIEGRAYPTIIACITNKALACELFLKSIIIMNTKQLPNGHRIKDLVKEADIFEELKLMLNKYNLEDEINKISNAFIEWRYIYEINEATIFSGFLNDLCDTLEKVTRERILKIYNLDMLKSFL